MLHSLVALKGRRILQKIDTAQKAGCGDRRSLPAKAALAQSSAFCLSSSSQRSLRVTSPPPRSRWRVMSGLLELSSSAPPTSAHPYAVDVRGEEHHRNREDQQLVELVREQAAGDL